MAAEKDPIERKEFIGKLAVAGAAAAAVLAGGAAGNASALLEKKEKLRWGFMVDLRKCIGCKACSVACKQEFDVRLGVFRASVKEYAPDTEPAGRKFVPWLCNHCENPVCITRCPVDEVQAGFTFPGGKKVKYTKRATYQRPDGVVLIDQDRCIGCGNCVKDCPYNVRYLDPAKGVADKCTLCIHRLEQGVVPSCVNTCQGRARMAGNIADSGSEIAKAIAGAKTDVLLAEKGTNPQCFYIGLGHDAYANGRDVR